MPSLRRNNVPSFLIPRKRTNRLEPTDEVILRLSEAAKLASSGNEETKFNFLKNVGSNFFLKDRQIAVTWKEPLAVAVEWKARLAASPEKPVAKDTNELWLAVSG